MQKDINYDVIKSAYDFTLSADGELYGLVAGDHGFEPTGIFISEETLEIWKLGVIQSDKNSKE